MKRMYLVLGGILVLLIWSISVLGQKDIRPAPAEEDPLKKALELREEMHRRMRDTLLRGLRHDDDMFSDMEKLFEDAMSDSFSGFGTSLGITTTQNYQTAWIEDEKGRTLAITPREKNQNLDITVEKGFVTIKGKTESKSGRSSSISSFSNSFNVPSDVDWTKVKMDQKDGKILVHFPWKDLKTIEKKPRESERLPVPPSEGDVAI